MTHDEIIDLLGAYALDAVDPSEAAAVAAHLATCPRCRDEVARYQQTAAVLASTGSAAPPHVWDAIAGRIERPEGVVAPFPLARPASRPAPFRRPSRRRRAFAPVATVAAAAAVAAIAILGVQVGDLNHRLDQVASTSSTQTLTAAARSALLDPTARRITLASSEGGSGPAAELVILHSGSGYLFNNRLPALDANRTYQLWAMTDGRAISVGLIGNRPSTVAFSVDAADPTNAYAITAEPAGGSVSPTRPPAASTAL